MKARVLIVDDEPLARERLRDLLTDDPEVAVVGEAADGDQAAEAIRTLAPDLVFLDVQMPGRDGFAALAELEPAQLPLTVFVTAYDQYALKAFEVHALDYLLKPFDAERFRSALARAKERLARDRAGDIKNNLLALLGQTADGPRPLERVAIKSGEGIFFLRTDEIDWVEAAGNFVRFHCGGKAWLHRETMSRLEAKLDPEKFVRIHRSTIVAVEAVKELQPLFHGDYTVVLRDGTELTLSRNHRPRLQKFFGSF
jgi:two-component system, LytTR family, response regulator